MHVLVTGGAGFIGSHVASALEARGDRVTVLDLFTPDYDPARKERNVAGLRARVVRGDIAAPGVVEAALGDAEVVVHLAARGGVRESFREEASYRRINVDGTARVLDAARAHGARVVLASSSSVYGARLDGPFREDDPVAPASPYAATKVEAEALARAAASTGLPVTVLRPFTVYGPRQRPGMAIGRFVRAALTGEAAPFYGDGATARDYTFDDDRPLGHAVLNVGSGAPVRLDALVEAVARAVGSPVPLDRRPEAPGDVPLTWADRARAGASLGWAPRVGLEVGLARTVTWFREGEP